MSKLRLSSLTFKLFLAMPMKWPMLSVSAVWYDLESNRSPDNMVKVTITSVPLVSINSASDAPDPLGVLVGELVSLVLRVSIG